MDLQLLWSSGSTGFTKLWWQALQKSKIHCGDLDLCCLHNTATCKLRLHCYTHAPANKKFRPVIKTKMCLLQWCNTRPIVYPPRRGQRKMVKFPFQNMTIRLFSSPLDGQVTWKNMAAVVACTSLSGESFVGWWTLNGPRVYSSSESGENHVETPPLYTTNRLKKQENLSVADRDLCQGSPQPPWKCST